MSAVLRRIQAIPNESAFPGERGRIVEQRLLDPLAHIREILELGQQTPDERRFALG